MYWVIILTYTPIGKPLTIVNLQPVDGMLDLVPTAAQQMVWAP